MYTLTKMTNYSTKSNWSIGSSAVELILGIVCLMFHMISLSVNFNKLTIQFVSEDLLVIRANAKAKRI